MCKKILYIHPNADLYGASRSLLRLTTSLDRERFEPIVVLPEDGPLAVALRQHGIQVEVIPYLGVIQRRVLRSWRLPGFAFSLLPSTWRIWRLIRQEQIDLVHSNTATTITPGFAAWLAGVPHVWHLREMFADDFARLWPYFRAFMLRFSTRILCVSTPIAAQFPPHPQVRVLHNGLELSEFVVDPAEVQAWRDRYCLSPDTRLVGVASRISPWKGQDIFVQACAWLKKTGLDQVRYLIIGDAFTGNEYLIEQLQAYVRENGLSEDVVFTGFVENPKPLIAALDVLVLPSTRPDPFPGIVLEGMALGVPVIGTAIGGPLEQIEHGVTGLLVPPADPEALAQAIEKLLRDPVGRKTMGQAGRNRLETCFTLDTVVEYLQTFYQELVPRL